MAAPGCVTPAPARIPELPATGLCYHDGGSVIHKNETFALVWNLFADGDAHLLDYAAPTSQQLPSRRGRLTAARSSSPYSITSQYARAPTAVAAQPVALWRRLRRLAKHRLPASRLLAHVTHCPPPVTVLSTETTSWAEPVVGVPPKRFRHRPTPDRLRSPSCEATMHRPQRRPDQRTPSPGTPRWSRLLTPPGVVVCLISAGTRASVNVPCPAAAGLGDHLPPRPTPSVTVPAGTYHVEITYETTCSANSDLHSNNAASNVTAQFCSYHSQLNVGGTMYDLHPSCSHRYG